MATLKIHTHGSNFDWVFDVTDVATGNTVELQDVDSLINTKGSKWGEHRLNVLPHEFDPGFAPTAPITEFMVTRSGRDEREATLEIHLCHKAYGFLLGDDGKTIDRLGH